MMSQINRLAEKEIAQFCINDAECGRAQMLLLINARRIHAYEGNRDSVCRLPI